MERKAQAQWIGRDPAYFQLCAQELARRVAALEPIRLDGQAWFRARDVYRALRIDDARARRTIDPAHRRAQREGRSYDVRRVTLIDREAVETLVIRFVDAPRAILMAALPK